ncbi:MAG: respiratory chain complex I subunit 1 family protein [Actinomycetales bacterium]
MTTAILTSAVTPPAIAAAAAASTVAATATAALAILIQVTAITAAAPLVVGVTRQVRARMEGRAGAGITQPWRDLRKLARKTPLTADGVLLGSALPVALMATSVLLVALLPLVTTVTLPAIPDDLFVVVSVLLLGSVLIALVGLDAGTAFGGMGSSRHMMVSALVEPTVLVAVYALSIPVSASTLSTILTARMNDPASIVSPVSVLALVALLVAVIAETGRLPVDNPSTHLELTMIHEAMVLEASGRDLGWLELASWLRLTALLGLLANLAAPWGIAGQVSPGALVLGTAAVVVKVLVLAAVVAAIEVFLAKVRLFRVPELLAGSFVLAFLAVTASYLTVTP